MRSKKLITLIAACMLTLYAGAGCGVYGERVDLETYRKPATPGVLESDAPSRPETNPEILYKIGNYDKIELEISEHPEMSNKALKVASDGSITIPVLEERVSVTGLNTTQVEGRISEIIAPYVVGKPNVKVTIRQSRSRYFICLGAIRRHGKYFMGLEDVTVRDAILNAGLWGRGANRDKVYVITPDEEDEPTYVIVDGDRIMKGDLRQNIVLRPGDILYVPTTVYYKVTFVMDEIIGQAERVQEVDRNVISYGKHVNREGYGEYHHGYGWDND